MLEQCVLTGPQLDATQRFYFAGIPSPPLLKHLLKVEGGAAQLTGPPPRLDATQRFWPATRSLPETLWQAVLCHMRESWVAKSW